MKARQTIESLRELFGEEKVFICIYPVSNENCDTIWTGYLDKVPTEYLTLVIEHCDTPTASGLSVFVEYKELDKLSMKKISHLKVAEINKIRTEGIDFAKKILCLSNQHEYAIGDSMASISLDAEIGDVFARNYNNETYFYIVIGLVGKKEPFCYVIYPIPDSKSKAEQEFDAIIHRNDLNGYGDVALKFEDVRLTGFYPFHLIEAKFKLIDSTKEQDEYIYFNVDLDCLDCLEDCSQVSWCYSVPVGSEDDLTEFTFDISESTCRILFQELFDLYRTGIVRNKESFK